jgi:hypothetical protein
MAIMIVKETCPDREQEYELNRENIQQIVTRTGLDETTIYTTLNMGRAIEDGQYRWIMVRQ